MPYRILSFDGGGMRGLLTVHLLQRLQEAHPSLLSSADMFAGTSSGGLIAIALAAGLPLERIRKLFEDEGPRIFADSPFDEIADVGRLLGADYASGPLEGILRELFGETTLGSLGKSVLITAFDLDTADDPRYGGTFDENRRWKAKIMHNFPGSDSDAKVPAWAAAMRTTAAPVYFPSAQGYIDGGVFASNPAMCALAQTQDTRSFERPPSLGEVALLSLGTGEVSQFISGERHDWGVVQWGRRLVDIVISGSVGVVSYQCRSMLGERFERVSPRLERSERLRLDSHSPCDLARMQRIGTEYPLADTCLWLERYW